MQNHDSRKLVLIVATITSFMFPFMLSAVNIALPQIAREFSLNAVHLNWVPLSYVITTAIFMMPAGKLTDKLGAKKVLLFGMSLFLVGTLLCGFSVSAAMFICFRTLQGIGAALMATANTAALTTVYPPGERGKALGINVAGVYIGLSLGPFIGGVITQSLGWRSIFYIVIPIALFLLAALGSLRFAWTEKKSGRFDYLGSVLFAAGLIWLFLGFSYAAEGLTGLSMIAVGIIFFGVFGFYEMRITEPVIQLDMFKNNRLVTFSSLAALINYSATYAVSFLLSLYLQYVKGFQPQTAGLILAVQPALQAFLSPLAGRLSDRVDPQKVSSYGMILTTAGLSLFVSLSEKTPIGLVIAALIILGFGFALFSSPNTNAVMGSVDKKYYGAASAALGLSRTVGQTLSMGITTVVLAIIMGKVSIDRQNLPAFIHSVHIIFVVVSVLCFLGIFASLARGKNKTAC